MQNLLATTYDHELRITQETTNLTEETGDDNKKATLLSGVELLVCVLLRKRERIKI